MAPCPASARRRSSSSPSGARWHRRRRASPTAEPRAVPRRVRQRSPLPQRTRGPSVPGMPHPRLLLLIIPAVALAGCSLEDDGPPTSQTRQVAPFTRIDNPSSVDVVLTVGKPQQLRVRAGKKVISDVHTDVRDGTLHVDFDHHGWGGDDVVVEASIERLDGVTADGSGDIEVTGIDSGK